MEENVRHGHIYVQLMKQHKSEIEQITRYSLKTDQQNDASSYTFLQNFSGQ